jgi:hypothetical protein
MVPVIDKFFLQKMGWATYWATFPQTHLVPLVKTPSAVCPQLAVKTLRYT